MPLDIVLFSLTFATGVIAFLNLCASLCFQLIFELSGKVLQLQSGTTTSNHNSKFLSRRLVYALLGALWRQLVLSQFSQESDGGFHIMDLDSKIISIDRLCKCTSCYRKRNSKTYAKILLLQHPDFQILFMK